MAPKPIPKRKVKKAPGIPYQKGHKKLGRPPGVLNKVTIEAREFGRAIVSDPGYQRKFEARARAGTLHYQLETMLWHYAFGKPKERVELSGPAGGPIEMAQVMTSDENRQRVNQLAAIARDRMAKARAAAEPSSRDPDNHR